MKKVWYLPTVDEANKPLVVKVKVIGERDGWRMLHKLGVPYKGEGEIVVHQRHITQNWLAAWMKAKKISRFRSGDRNGHTPARCNGAMAR